LAKSEEIPEPPDASAGEDPRAGGARSLAASLEPQLLEACRGRLGPITWFRTDWQRGGAATGSASWHPDGGETGDAAVAVGAGAANGDGKAVVKVPVHPRELRWLRRLQADRPAAVPRLLASGDSLGGYDLAWVAIEHLPVGPLANHWQAAFMPLLAEAAASFGAAAASASVPPEPIRERHDWPHLLATARRHVKDLRLAEPKAWNGRLRTVEQRLPALLQEWADRRPVEWIHGDLHPANAMSREAIALEDGVARGEVCLIDFAEIRSGHWVEDAVYFERLHWSVPDRLKGHPPLRAIAAARKARGLDNGPDPSRLAAIRRLLMAATAPAFAKTEGHPAYLEACRRRLEESLASLR
jgi:aminoglycoside phosphotransferase (APT) family kinase protein